ncbi:hypothetical protein NDU88_007446 [Pleurodeles waltl]|uniref:Uncharacterized protein n=1 Tax=Pleurodeles waltl TaxID=8319 RepID=A0AAV7VQI9_PLEWA|nr:hypothetical protein NDU88_007446 [Pleurodeles waltl]
MQHPQQCRTRSSLRPAATRRAAACSERPARSEKRPQGDLRYGRTSTVRSRTPARDRAMGDPHTLREMPNGKPSGKHSRQLLFSEDVTQSKTMTMQTSTPCPTSLPTDPPALEATEHILQEIASVGRRLEAMDLKITDLTITSSSIRANIAGFKEPADALD